MYMGSKMDLNACFFHDFNFFNILKCPLHIAEGASVLCAYLVLVS